MSKRRSLDHLAGNNIEETIENNTEETKSNLELFAEEDAENKDKKEDTKADDNAEENKEKKEIKVAGKVGKLLSKEEKKPKKMGTMIYLEKETLDQFKTLSMIFKMNDNVENHSVTKLMEMACLEFIKGQDVDAELVAEYDRVNSNRGRKKKED